MDKHTEKQGQKNLGLEVNLKSVSEEFWPEGQNISVSNMVYNELDLVPVKEMSQLELLEKNMAQLSLVRDQLKFMMREIRYLMKV